MEMRGVLIARAIEFAIAAHSCRSAADADPEALQGLYRAADRYSAECARLINEAMLVRAGGR